MRIRHAAAVAAIFAFTLGAARADEKKQPPPPAPAAASAPAPAPPAASAPADPSKTEGRYKNIQVLKGYPADDLVPTMQFISSALGVDCEFCHVERAPEKDDKKEKQTARKMMAMMFAINRENFDGHREVTCVSCHRGAERPATIPEVVTAEPKPEAAPAPAAGEPPAASAVLDKYLAAVGGADAVAKVTGHVQKGQLSGFGPDAVPVDVVAKAEGKRMTTVHNPRGDNITAVNGEHGWLGNPGRPARDMSAIESESARLDAALLFPSDLKRLFASFEVGPAGQVDGKDAVLVIAKNEGKPPAKIWFDAQSGLAVRLVRYVETPLGRNPTQIDYTDYRDAGGVKIPFRWTVARPSGRFTIQLDESQQGVPIDDKVFVKPPPPPPPPAAPAAPPS